MSSYFLQPSINTWQNQLDPFIASFLAYDDTGRRISNKQLYIVYDVAYGTDTPDLENHGTTLFSNKDGVIELHFAGRCKVSIDLYMVESFDENLDSTEMADHYICRHICNDLLLPFAAYITDFKASYISTQKVAVGKSIPRKYVQVTLTKSDDSTARFTIENPLYDDYIISPDTITQVNDNQVTVSYYDSLLDKTWEYDIIVLGKVAELEISAIYVGQDKQLNSLVVKSEVLVTLTTFDGHNQHSRLLDSDEWEFAVFPQITNLNLGILEIARESLRATIRVPFKWIPDIGRLDAWYEGTPVLVGNKLVPDDFRIWLWHEGLREMIPFNQCQISPQNFTITQEGVNWYTVSYKIDAWTIQDKVAIIGYKEIEYEEKDFELLYYDPNLHCLKDVTEEFDEACTIAGNRYFNWNKILDRVIDTIMYGRYKLYAPVRTGLSVRCDTEWIITCEYKKAINAQLHKVYCDEKEDDTNGI